MFHFHRRQRLTYCIIYLVVVLEFRNTEPNGVNVIKGVRNMHTEESWIMVHERKVMLEELKMYGVKNKFYMYKPLGLTFQCCYDKVQPPTRSQKFQLCVNSYLLHNEIKFIPLTYSRPQYRSSRDLGPPLRQISILVYHYSFPLQL